MLTAGITLIKFGVMPLYNPNIPSLSNIVLKTPVIVKLAWSIVGVTTEKQKKKEE